MRPPTWLTPDDDDRKDVTAFFNSTKGLVVTGLLALGIVAALVYAVIASL